MTTNIDSEDRDFDDAINTLVAYASGEKIAKEIKPSFWQKIVAKIPGVCRLNQMDAEQIKKDLKRAKALQKAIKKADAADDKKEVYKLVLEALRLVDPSYKGLGAELNFALYKKKYKDYVKAGDAILDLREEEKSVKGLQAACSKNKKKKKKGCASCTSDVETITAAQIQVMAKLVELGETKAAHNLGKQLVSQLQESPSGGTPSAEALPSESAEVTDEVTEVVADKRDEITSILEDKGSTMKTISNEEIEILSTLVDLGHKDEALKLAQGLAERSSGDRDELVAPEEKKARTEWSRDVDVAAKRSYQFLKSTLKGVERITWDRIHGGDKNQTSEGATFDIDFEDGRNIVLDFSVVDNEYAGVHVSTNNLLDYDPRGYMKDLGSDDSVSDALKNIRALWAWVGDGRKLKEGEAKTSAGDQDIVELVASGKIDEALQKLTADSEETPTKEASKDKEARWAPEWAKDVERAAMRSYQFLKKTLKGLEDITYDFSGGASTKSSHSQIAYIYPTFEDGRSIILEIVVTDHEYGDITVTTNNMLDYDPKGFSKELEYEEDIPKTLKNVRALWSWVGDGKKLKEGQVSDDKTGDIIALLGEGKTGEAIREILSAKETPDNEKYAAADAVKLRRKVVDLETYLNHKILPLRTEFPSEGEIIDNPKGYVKPMKKTLSLLEKIEDLIIDYNATDLFRV